ncbi:MAG TPA: class I SAM-dependent methyltransferase [Gemmatimonadaceae bacterium]|nr:class I SAM-dependent methyltransferase [Gemmatimonadaceae bacterium]
MSFHSVDACRICGNTKLVSLLNLGQQSLTGVFPRRRDQALTKGPLELVKCEGGDEACGLVQLRHSYDSAEMYGDNYGYRSSLNASMVAHLQRKVASLLQLARPSGDDIVLDIGSNDGTTLSFYPETLTRVGMDPTADRFREYYKPGIHIVPDFFSSARFGEELGDRRAKIVTSIAMFYDLERPLEFVEQVASVLDDDGIWHFEQSYMPLMLSRTAYDTICHEHLEYYGLRQIQWMIERSGLKILDVELNDINGGSFAVTVAKQTSPLNANTDAIERIVREEEEEGINTLAPYHQFAERVFEHRDQLKSLLDELRRKNARVVGYGASTKGNVILQFCDVTSEDVPAIADVNEDKFGCYTPGTGIPIISESEAHAMKPEYFLVLPWHFRDNLVQREKNFLRSGGKMIFPLPSIEVVSN